MSATESPEEIVARLKGQPLPPVRSVKVPIAITGGRDYIPTPEDMGIFWEHFDELGGTELHHGDSRGVDRFVANAVRRARPDIPVIAHPADWQGEGRRAGPLRNRSMISACHALIAFPGNKGTQNCIDETRRQGKAVRFVLKRLEY